jgi:hypothetical protein
MIDTDKYGEQDWLVRYYDREGKHGDAMDYDGLEEAVESFKESIVAHPTYEWTLYHYYNYKPDGQGGWHEPTEECVMYWDGEELFEYD